MPRMSTRLSAGRDLQSCPDITRAVEISVKSGFDFVCLPIVNPRFRREFISGPAKNRGGAMTRSDTTLSSQDWSTLVVGKLSPWLQLDSTNTTIRTNSEAAFRQELSLCAHLGLPAVSINLKSRNSVNLARNLSEHLQHPYYSQHFWIQVPLLSPADQCDLLIEGDEKDPDQTFEDTWEWWHQFRTLCDSNKRLSVCLELTADLPPEHVQERWLSEPVRAVMVPTGLFLSNKKGYPVLSRGHQSFLGKLFKLDIQVVLTGVDRHPDKGLRAYHQYLDHLWQTQQPVDAVASYARGYEDYLQSPLQPLMDNLESQTYETFEKDPVKYTQYQRAIYNALMDMIPADEKNTKELVVMVVGAGRGPLVKAALGAASQADRKLKKVYAVEKNPNAIITLENLRDELWGDVVEVVSCDMRTWEAPVKADILISELLGSFGDNELSPECLDGAQRFLQEGGISIPSEYTSFMAPVQSCKLYNEVRKNAEKDKPPEAHFEMPYVVRMHNCVSLDKPKPVFTFTHPNKDEVIDNNRYTVLEYNVKDVSVLHGLAGYFEAVLYKEITLSTVPETHSPGMFSWFPILFPIRMPLYIGADQRVVVDIWRRCTSKNVWYEWAVREPTALPIHNPKGRSYTIGL